MRAGENPVRVLPLLAWEQFNEFRLSSNVAASKIFVERARKCPVDNLKKLFFSVIFILKSNAKLLRFIS